MKYLVLSLFLTVCIYAENSFSPLPDYVIADVNKVELGKMLFFDPLLSSDKKISCSSCHQLDKGGADGKVISLGADGKKGRLNTPSIFNSSLNSTKGWISSDTKVRQRAKSAFNNPLEMNGNISNTLKYLKDTPAYVSKFAKSYKNITEEALFDAIEAYISSLLTPSPFDDYLNGNQNALSDSQKRGLKLFQEKGCASCHNGVNIGGGMHQKLGVFNQEFFSRGEHLGRYEETKKERDRYVFRVPSLRNVTLTAPYLHDGSVKTIREIIKIVETYQLGEKFKDSEINDIESFLKSLNGRVPNEQ